MSIESQFGIIEGVIRTRVGYAGGSTDSPTYRSIGDHTETVQVDFDPEKFTYRQLLDVLWNSHSYIRQTGITQYKNVIFYRNEEQRQKAMASKNALEQNTGRTVQTLWIQRPQHVSTGMPVRTGPWHNFYVRFKAWE